MNRGIGRGPCFRSHGLMGLDRCRHSRPAANVSIHPFRFKTNVTIVRQPIRTSNGIQQSPMLLFQTGTPTLQCLYIIHHAHQRTVSIRLEVHPRFREDQPQLGNTLRDAMTPLLLAEIALRPTFFTIGFIFRDEEVGQGRIRVWPRGGSCVFSRFGTRLRACCGEMRRGGHCLGHCRGGGCHCCCCCLRGARAGHCLRLIGYGGCIPRIRWKGWE
mmetsp:Transcript_6078/g.13763  ORF Transcript_6078/g.13763 Transcript_6078/m.13763 type:complete len:215 (+) Transcript_6078:1433-2077(+)